MAKLVCRLMAVLTLIAFPLYGQPTVPARPEFRVDPRAALIEVLPPAVMQQSPAAIELIDRLVHKHELLLQHPSLIARVLKDEKVKATKWAQSNQNNAADQLIGAMHVRTVPGSNIIEVLLDSTVVGDDSPVITEAIVNEHIENAKRAAMDGQLERSVMLNNLKNRFQFRKDDLNRDLREKAVQLAVDGMGTPGRLSAKEVELQNLLQLRFELDRKLSDATTDDAKHSLQAQKKDIEDRIGSSKADLGALTNAMNQYLALKDDEQTNRDQLRQVNEQLEQIQQLANIDNSDIRWLCHPSH